jgi:hypothetical protein
VDIDSHPPIPLGKGTISILAIFVSSVFQVPNFQGCFEALNDGFWDRKLLECSRRQY